jgi:hypothetical protein
MNRTLIALATVAVLATVSVHTLAQEQSRTRLSPQSGKPPATADRPVGAAEPAKKAPLPESVLATGPTPLTRAMVAEMAEALGRAIGSPLNATEVFRLEQRAVDFWGRSSGYQESVRAAHARLVAETDRVESFPAAARPSAWKQAEARLLAETKEHPETFLADALRRAESVAHDQYVLGEPPFSKSSAQAYFEMRDYVADLRQGKIKAPKVGEVLQGGADIAVYFQKAPLDERNFLHAADRIWALARAHLATSTPERSAEVKQRAVEVLSQPNALDANGLPTVAAVRSFVEKARLTEPRSDCYWTAPE